MRRASWRFWGVVGAPLLVACGAPTADEDGSGGEAIGSVAQAATDPALDAKFVGTSVAGGWRFRGDVAEYAMCPNVPIGVRYDFKNVGKVVLQDVEGQGDKKGSDVKLVTTSGNADPITKKTHFSVRDNDNAFVSPDPDAPDCYDEKGCKKTRFKKFAFAPAEAGVHTSKWRLRDYSSVWDGKSQGFGPKIAVRYKVTPGGCTYRCKTGVTKDVVASAETCAAVAASMCDGSEKVQTAMYLSCDAPGLVGPGGTGGTGGTGGSGGSGGTGGGGSGGGGTGGGGAGTAGAGGSAGGSACDCELLPGLEAGEPCCLPDGQCGVTADFLQWQCYPLPDDSDFDENELTPPDDGSHLGEEDFEDDPGFHDPPGLEEQGGVTLADGGGCSASARRPGASWLWSGFAVAALAIRRQRRRLASRLTLRGTRPARYNT